MTLFNKQYIVVDSADNKASTTSHNPVTVDYRQDINAGLIKLEHFNIPNVTYTVLDLNYGGNRSITWSPSIFDDTFQLDVGTYTIEGLLAEIEGKLQDLTSNNSNTILMGYVNERVTLISDVAFDIDWKEIGVMLGYYIRYDPLVPTILSSTEISETNHRLVATLPVDLELNEIFIHVDQFSSNMLASNGSYPTFCIPNDANPGEVLFHDNRSSFEMSCTNQQNTRTLHVSLRDGRGRELTGVGDWTMLLSVEKPNDNI